jgi:DNA helicase HerA-like ATPase
MLPFEPTAQDDQPGNHQRDADNGQVVHGSLQDGNVGTPITSGPRLAQVDQHIDRYEAMSTDQTLEQCAMASAKAIAFVHFDTTTPKNNIVEALVHQGDLIKIDRGLYVLIVSDEDQRRYSGRIVEGPFFDPDVLKRDSTPVQFIILNQGQGKRLSLPEYHGRIHIELLGEEVNGLLYPTTRRPRPASPVFSYQSSMMSDMLNLQGNILLGHLDTYKDVFVYLDGNNKDYLPRNVLTVGTVGSGKSNTDQVLIEETLAANYAQIVVDPEGEYTLMDKPVETAGIQEVLALYQREPRGVANLTVYRPPLCGSKRPDAVEFSVPFDSLSPELIAEITDMNPTQAMRFTFLYEQAIAVMRKEGRGQDQKLGEEEEANLSRGYPGMTLDFLLDLLDQEFAHYEYKREEESAGKGKKSKGAAKPGDASDAAENDLPDSEVNFYCRVHRLKPLFVDQYDPSSYGALRKKLRELRSTRLFDRRDAPKLDMVRLSEPGHLTVIDMSDCDDREVKNIIIADLLARVYRYKMDLDEETNKQRKVMLTLEEAHGFVSRENKGKMEQTLSQLQRIARRGRKRWLILHFVTQSPQHLPSELFELANNKIIHQTTGTENLRVLKLAAGTINDGIWDDVPSLGIGRAIVVSSQYPHPIIVRIRPAASQRNYTL